MSRKTHYTREANSIVIAREDILQILQDDSAKVSQYHRPGMTRTQLLTIAAANKGLRYYSGDINRNYRSQGLDVTGFDRTLKQLLDDADLVTTLTANEYERDLSLVLPYGVRSNSGVIMLLSDYGRMKDAYTEAKAEAEAGEKADRIRARALEILAKRYPRELASIQFQLREGHEVTA